MYPFVKRIAFFFALLCYFFYLPETCDASIQVQLVWKFGQAGWVEVKINDGEYLLKSGAKNIKLEPGSTLQLGWGGWAPVYRVNQASFQTATPSKFDLKGAGSFSILTPEGTRTSYRGELTAEWAGDHWKLANGLDKEDYLKGVVPIEMSNAWSKDGLEALKAQAIAARTYMEKHIQAGKSLTDSPDIDQAYLGKSVEGAASLAVEATRSEILIDASSRQPIDAFYSSHDGGFTEDAQNVWGNHDSHYEAKLDPYSLGVGGPAGNWYFLISARELGKSFGIETVKKIELDKLPSGRVQKVKMEDNQGKVLDVTGRTFVKKFYPFGKEIRTEAFLGTLFETSRFPVPDSIHTKQRIPGGDNPIPILPGPRLSRIISSNDGLLPYNQPDGVFIFKGRGWGHGVGMSQWGAYHMAQMGYSYRDILAFYYENTTLGHTT